MGAKFNVSIRIPGWLISDKVEFLYIEMEYPLYVKLVYKKAAIPMEGYYF